VNDDEATKFESVKLETRLPDEGDNKYRQIAEGI